MDICSLTSVRDARFIDIRSKEIFEKSHIKNAVNIPVDELPTRFRELNSLGEVPLILYCDHAEKSKHAVSYLRKQRMVNVYNGGAYEVLSHHLKLNSICSIF